MRGEFLSEEDAENKSLELVCKGIHKNQAKWLPCKNDRELHRKVAASSAIPLLITIYRELYSFL